VPTDPLRFSIALVVRRLRYSAPVTPSDCSDSVSAIASRSDPAGRGSEGRRHYLNELPGIRGT